MCLIVYVIQQCFYCMGMIKLWFFYINWDNKVINVKKIDIIYINVHLTKECKRYIFYKFFWWFVIHFQVSTGIFFVSQGGVVLYHPASEILPVIDKVWRNSILCCFIFIIDTILLYILLIPNLYFIFDVFTI